MTPRLLLHQWTVEMNHKAAGFGFSSLALSAADWEAIDWNAREAVHLNNRWRRMPEFWRQCVLPQDRINFHLLHALQLLVGAWRHCLMLPEVQAISALPPHGDRLLAVARARGLQEGARAKHDSLVHRRDLLRQFSLRQWRIYQQLAAFYSDLHPLVAALGGHFDEAGPAGAELRQILADIDWHTRELKGRVDQAGARPGLRARMAAPRIEINRLIGANCVYHSAFLKHLMRPEPACVS